MFKLPFLSSRPQNQAQWLEGRLDQLATCLEAWEEVTVRNVSLVGVPGRIVDAVFAPRWHFEDPYVTRPRATTTQLRIDCVEDGDFDISLGINPGGDADVELVWSSAWSQDWSGGAGTILALDLRVVPTSFDPAVVEVFEALCLDGQPSTSALRAALRM